MLLAVADSGEVNADDAHVLIEQGMNQFEGKLWMLAEVFRGGVAFLLYEAGMEIAYRCGFNTLPISTESSKS